MNAIIIENKMYALLYNDLQSYYKCINAEVSKIGVVLSLLPQAKLPDTYINITHKDFLDRVTGNLGNYLFRASEKYLLLLKDLCQEINMFIKSKTMKHFVTFYFKHAEKVNELCKIRTRAMDAILEDLKKAFASTSFKWGRKYPESLNIRFDEHPNVLLILKTDSLFDKASYTLEYWLTFDMAKKWSQSSFKERIKQNAQTPANFVFNSEKTGEKYAMIGKQEVIFERTLEALEQLPLRFTEELNNNWTPFIRQTLNIMKEASISNLNPMK